MIPKKYGLIVVYVISGGLLVAGLLSLAHRRGGKSLRGLRSSPGDGLQARSSRSDRSVVAPFSSLEEFFEKVDTSQDGQISLKEMSIHLGRTVQSHMQDALRGNMKHFFGLDKTDTNGLVEWEEWLKSFHDDFPSLVPRKAKEALAEAKARWSEAARTNPNALNIDEFLSFSHPEFSHPALLQQVDEMIQVLDVNQDQILDFHEFTLHTPRAKRKEFELLDQDQDGLVNKRELFPFLDPKSKVWSRRTARRIVNSLDTDNDNAVSFRELMGSGDPALLENLQPERVFFSFV
eukprot:maker-scaffold1830_size26949-snap-gene-0.8 protein:Tk12642 transcript:maker-scaffold1830_size26949-snap-gene-0.8-mRNA-1 annotation:"reticulocalbin "